LELAPWQAQLAGRYAPSTLVLALGDDIAGLPPAMDKPAQPGVNAWVCRGVECLPPIREPALLERALQ